MSRRRRLGRPGRAGAMLLTLTLVLGSLWPHPVRAVEPSEMLKNPALEARARQISQGLRCLVCRNENIDESDAALAHDLRVLVRQRLLAGDSNKQVVDYIVARYGEYALLRPEMNGANLILWYAGPGMALLGFGLAGAYLYRRRRDAARAARLEAALSPEEERRLAEILND